MSFPPPKQKLNLRRLEALLLTACQTIPQKHNSFSAHKKSYTKNNISFNSKSECQPTFAFLICYTIIASFYN